MIKGIVFDYDGTLSCRYKAAYAMYRRIVTELSAGRITEPYEVESIIQKCMIWDQYGNIGKNYVFGKLKGEYFPEMDTEYWSKFWLEEFCNYQVLMDGAEELLMQLSGKYKLGVITNGDGRSQNAKLTAVGIRQYFDTIVVGGDFGIQKPDPSIYIYTAEKMGLQCDEIAFIGDTFATDILGALRAGMHAVWVCNEHKGISDYPVEQIGDIREAGKLFL